MVWIFGNHCGPWVLRGCVCRERGREREHTVTIYPTTRGINFSEKGLCIFKNYANNLRIYPNFKVSLCLERAAIFLNPCHLSLLFTQVDGFFKKKDNKPLVFPQPFVVHWILSPFFEFYSLMHGDFFPQKRTYYARYLEHELAF